jgi:integral membrane protein
MKKIFSRFRKVAIAEGVSFLVLLLIGMPLKYAAGIPMATMIAGSIHGVLFIAFIYLAWEVKEDYKKGWGWFGKAFLASILPFGTFVMDKYWKQEAIA